MITIDGTRVDAFGSTDAGKIRPGNQDHYLIATLRRILEIEATSIPLGTSQRLANAARPRRRGARRRRER
jgi:hypothetical protein